MLLLYHQALSYDNRVWERRHPISWRNRMSWFTSAPEQASRQKDGPVEGSAQGGVLPDVARLAPLYAAVDADAAQGGFAVGGAEVAGQVAQGVRPELVFGLVAQTEAEAGFVDGVAGADEGLNLDDGG